MNECSQGSQVHRVQKLPISFNFRQLLQTSKLHEVFRLTQEQRAESFCIMSTMQNAGCSGIKHAGTGLWSSGDMFSGVTNHASSSDNPMDETGFGGFQENGTRLTASCQV